MIREDEKRGPPSKAGQRVEPGRALAQRGGGSQRSGLFRRARKIAGPDLREPTRELSHSSPLRPPTIRSFGSSMLKRMKQPVIDVLIAVHSSSRPIARAVASVLDNTAAPARVTVIAHNIDRSVIERNLDRWASDSRVQLISLIDEIQSPAGPLNLGLAGATAPFIAIMGSDDEFEAGALDSWLAMQRRTGAAAVIARIHHVGRGNDAYPPVRPGRRLKLDAVKDRLAYRSAPLGLISREHFGGLRFTEGLHSGEDVAYVTAMWFSGQRIAFDRTGPAYLGHHDADDRVSYTTRSIATDFAFLDEIYGTPWFERLALPQRRAIAIKMLRTHLFDGILNRSSGDPWPDKEKVALTMVVERILRSAPGVDKLLSIIDSQVLKHVLADDFSPDEMIELLKRRWNYKSVAAVLPSNPLYAMHRQGPFRTLLAGYLTTTPVHRRKRRAIQKIYDA